MRTHPIRLLAAGLLLAACTDEPAGLSEDGTVVVSTSTGGGDPDLDGYRLAVDGVSALAIDPTGTQSVVLSPGRHTVTLQDVAEHCTVAPGVSVEVDVPSGGTTPVAFEVSCPATGALVTVTTTGLDLDLDGYRLEVDGTDRAIAHSNGTVTLTRLDPGSRTVALRGLAANCTLEGPGSLTVTIVDAEVMPIEFAVVCTATTGVIGVIVRALGDIFAGDYWVMVGEAGPYRTGPGGPVYLNPVPAGNHAVTLLVPANCSVEDSPQSVTVAVGGLIRDTVDVVFSVACVPATGTLRITARTTGATPGNRYRVLLWTFDFYYGSYRTHLGELEPNGTLIAQATPGDHWLELTGVGPNCTVTVPNPTASFYLANGATLDFEFRATCVP